MKTYLLARMPASTLLSINVALRMNCCPSGSTGALRHLLLGVEMFLEDPHPGEDFGLPQRNDESDDEDEPGEAAHDVVPALGQRHV